MRTVRTNSLLAVCLALVAFAAGCASDPKSPGSSGVATQPAKTPTPTLSEEEQAVADAEAAYREWNRVWDSCMADPTNTYSSCFEMVSIGTQLSSDYVSLDMSKQDGTHMVGESKILSIELVSVDLTDRVDRPEDLEAGLPEVRTVPTVVFDVCVDLSETDFVDAAGESKLGPYFVTYRRNLVDVANYGYPDPAQWRVRNAAKDAETETCEP